MNVGILGAGFTGLSAAYYLLKAGHQVTIIEKEGDIGGLAVGFTQPNWDWTLERAYHHWFTNDAAALSLAKEITHPVWINRPQTKVYTQGKMLPFDSPTSLLRFPHLSLPEKIRAGAVLSYLKSTNNFQQFENQKALTWLRKNMGQKITELIWEPLFTGKFGEYKEDITLSWFWARIKKRTPSLAYPEGGFKSFAESLESRIKHLGGEMLLKTSVKEIKSSKDGVTITLVRGDSEESSQNTPAGKLLRPRKDSEIPSWQDPEQITYDKVISTLPSPIFTRVTPQLPKEYVTRINSIPHLHAQVLILVLTKPFLTDGTYWLNITDTSFPFLVLAEHTNFMDKSHYGNQHILYIGNYLPPDHPFLKMPYKDLLKVFGPYLSRLNSNWKLNIENCKLFVGPFAQPVVTVGYKDKIPTFRSPLKNIFVANMDMVYPWDRGTNYAIEFGSRIAEILNSNIEIRNNI